MRATSAGVCCKRNSVQKKNSRMGLVRTTFVSVFISLLYTSIMNILMYCTIYVLQLTSYLIRREKVARHIFHLHIPKIRIGSVMI
jgi:hypothetical protein